MLLTEVATTCTETPSRPSGRADASAPAPTQDTRRKARLNAADELRKQGEYEAAHMLYRELLEQRVGDDGMVAYIQNGIGLTYQAQERPTAALEWYGAALETKAKIAGKVDHSTDADTATIFANIGGCHRFLGDYTSAVRYLEIALEISIRLHTEDHADVADLYCDLGNLYHDQRDFERALECHLKDLAINRRLHSADDHSCFATTYHNIGLVYEAQRSFSLALEMFQRAWVIKAAERGPDHAEAAALRVAVERAAGRCRDSETLPPT